MRQCAVLLALAFLLSALAGPLAGRSLAGELTDAEKLEFAMNVALPSPSEMFLALNRLGGVDWSEVATVNERYDYDDNYSRALNLGLRAGDGLLAILAQNRDKLSRTIPVIVTLAEELMVQESILDRASTFENLADEGKWDVLREELESLRYQIEMEMDQLGDADIAVLVQVGGWLGAMRATADVFLNQLYGPELSSLFYQPGLVDYFAEQMLIMEPAARQNKAVQEIMFSLHAMRNLVDVGYQRPVPRENIRQLMTIANELIELIEEG